MDPHGEVWLEGKTHTDRLCSLNPDVCVGLSVPAPLVVLCFIFIPNEDTENHHMLKHSRDLSLDAYDR